MVSTEQATRRPAQHRSRRRGVASRSVLAGRTELTLFLARSGLLAAGARLRQWSRWPSRLVPVRIDRLAISPQDLRTSDPTRAAEFYAGSFSFTGRVVEDKGKSPFALDPPSLEWAEVLQGFGW